MTLSARRFRSDGVEGQGLGWGDTVEWAVHQICLRVDDAVAGDLSVSANAVLLYGRLTQYGGVSHTEDLADLVSCYGDLAKFLFYGKYWVLSIIKLNSHKHYSEVVTSPQST